MESITKKVALVGNPNSGKSSLFNHLTGLHQKIGNFPGVTVDKRVGYCQADEHTRLEILDLPGTYSVYPRSLDERVVFDLLSQPQGAEFPDLAVVVVDAANLKRNLLLFTQIIDMGIPTVLALNMVDVADTVGISVDEWVFMRRFQVPVIKINARRGEGLDKLKKIMAQEVLTSPVRIFEPDPLQEAVLAQVKNHFGLSNDYRAYQLLQQYEHISHFGTDDRALVRDMLAEHHLDRIGSQAQETLHRYRYIAEVLNQAVSAKSSTPKSHVTDRLDRLVVHRVWGYALFLLVLFVIFQAIFTWASWPMDMIDAVFSSIGTWLRETLPAGDLTSLLAEGIVPGIGGVVIFIPQIALLFGFISVLEESGYMSRVVF
ncbi:MAG: ferrous iron transporter B [Cytophagales bacterium]|nr:ferrous iron transporter B [Cytophagales bacterium]